ncbi:hypothetical protein DEQ92_05645 [Haloferax sp. Atlit-6N]|uniref:FAD-binding oxidoreductase n=1 Tax=Haloferax sp. Atlit-6N TaxID=2077205 RepID=UPI000E22EF52|nr:FAD-dependent oxidoreductase [Haloferax sp. Atlit-6N]REA05758.1 hypothetical protein DEQ92_05645 [Haloferax sp. Atlit-6N]
MDRSYPAVDDATIRDLDARLRGDALGPEADGYEEARTVWNAMIDRYPAVVVRPADTNDVVAAVTFARQYGLAVAVQGGGHNVAGHGVCDGGLLIDCSSMTEIRLDVETNTARVEPGVTVGEFDRATQVHGLGAPAGIISETGLAGLTLGGGWGWLSRSYGLTENSRRKPRPSGRG